MRVFVALSRAVNVGGTGLLAMNDLRRLCAAAGFEDAVTLLASGNVVFRSKLTPPKIEQKLEAMLTKHMGKPVDVLVRSRTELEAIAANNPFAKADPKRVLVLFLRKAPAKNALSQVVAPAREELRLVGRELFIHYPDGMGRSKLKLPKLPVGTGRNANTVARLVALARKLDD